MPGPMIASTLRLAPFTLQVANRSAILDAISAAALVQPVTAEPAPAATPLFRLRPELIAQMVALPQLTVFEPAAETPGYDRSAATKPIVDAPTPLDTSLFTSPDGATTYYLPRYRLKEVSNGRYDIAVTEAEGGGFRLAVGLDRFPPPEIAVPPGAQELPHTAIVLVSFTNVHGMTEELPLDEPVLDANGGLVGGAARLSTVLRESLIHSIGQLGQARLVVRRGIEVAAQIAAPADSGPAPKFMLARSMRHRLRVKRSPFEIARHFQDTGEELVDEPAVEEFAEPAPPPPPPTLRYQDVSQVLEQVAAPNPLFLSETLHPYFYVGGPAVAERVAQKRIAIPFADESGSERHFPYYQNSQDASIFFFLPDSYQLARRQKEPFAPEMLVRMSTPDGTLEKATAIIEYVVRPHISPDRLEAALARLANELPPTMVAEGKQPKLQPLAAFPKYRMRIPGAAGVEMKDYEGVSIDLANGFKHTLTATLPEFQQLFASAFSNNANSLFTGEVLVETGGTSPESVPVDIRFARTEGPMIDTVETTTADGRVEVKMRNGTESALSIKSLPVSIMRADQIIAANIEGLDLAQPLTLGSGQSIDFTVSPSDALTGDQPLDAIFDLSGIDVVPDAGSMLATIRDRSVPAEYEREIEIMTLPDLLNGKPDDPIVLISVEFKTGNSVKLTQDQQNTVASVKMPLVNILMGEDSKGAYQYRQLVVHRSGEQVTDSDWRQSDHDLLIVPVKS
jgi:hypothetical protein